MQNIVGIDPSLTGTGVCVYSTTQATEPWTTVIGSKPANFLQDRFNRYAVMCQKILQIIREAAPVCILIEGYSFGSNKAGHHDIVEYGALLRETVLNHRGDAEVLEVPPATLKKFATGKGNADKVAMATALVKRYGVTYGTSDEYDAYALCRLGACWMELEEPQTEWQVEAVEKLWDGPKRKAKKRANVEA